MRTHCSRHHSAHDLCANAFSSFSPSAVRERECEREREHEIHKQRSGDENKTPANCHVHGRALMQTLYTRDYRKTENKFIMRKAHRSKPSPE